MRRAITLATAITVALALAAPVGAITRGGEADGDDHPYVGLMVAYSSETFDHDRDEDTDERQIPLWRCSGALISPTVFVTAGHCVGAESSADDAAEPALAAIWFDEKVRDDSYPWYEEAPYTGVPHPHPDYEPDAFFLFDAGVVVLDGDGNDGLDEYAALPELGQLDDLAKGRKNASVVAVGYGLQKINPVMVQADLDRKNATLFVVNDTGVAGLGPVNPGQSIAVSGDAKHGGTCFGDSGGPMLIGDSNVIGAVTSFGLNGNCAGIGGGYRLDQADDLDWLAEF